MRRKLGELLIEAGAVTAGDVEAALTDQAAGEPSRIGDLLVSTGRCSSASVARALGVQLLLPFTDLSYVAPEASLLIPLEFQRAHKVVCFRIDKDQGAKRVHVAIADPLLTDVIDELRSQLKREVIVHVAPIDDIESVHAALAGEGAGEEVLMGEEVVEEEISLTDDTAVQFAFRPTALFEELSAEAGQIPAEPPAPFDQPRAPAVEQSVPWDLPPSPPSPGQSQIELSLAPTAPRAPGRQVPAGAARLDVEAPPIPPPPLIPPEPAADPAPVAAPSVTAEELFGSLDLDTPAEVVPLTTALADEIGRQHSPPPPQDFPGFAALAQPLGDPLADRFGPNAPSLPAADPVPLTQEAPLTPIPEPSLSAPLAPPVAPAAVPPVPSPAGPLPGELSVPRPSVPELWVASAQTVEVALDVPQIAPAPLISPIPEVEPAAFEATQKFAGLEGNLEPVNEATQKFAGLEASLEPPKIPSFAIAPEVPVKPLGSPPESPARRPVPVGRIALKRIAVNRGAETVEAPRPSLELPDWMGSALDAPSAPTLIVPARSGPTVVELLAQVEAGSIPSGPALAALLRLLIERDVIDGAAAAALLEKL